MGLELLKKLNDKEGTGSLYKPFGASFSLMPFPVPFLDGFPPQKIHYFLDNTDTVFPFYRLDSITSQAKDESSYRAEIYFNLITFEQVAIVKNGAAYVTDIQPQPGEYNLANTIDYERLEHETAKTMSMEELLYLQHVLTNILFFEKNGGIKTQWDMPGADQRAEFFHLSLSNNIYDYAKSLGATYLKVGIRQKPYDNPTHCCLSIVEYGTAPTPTSTFSLSHSIDHKYTSPPPWNPTGDSESTITVSSDLSVHSLDVVLKGGFAFFHTIYQKYYP